MDKYTIFELIILAHLGIIGLMLCVSNAFFTTLAHNLSSKKLMAVEYLTYFVWASLWLIGVGISAIMFAYNYNLYLWVAYGTISIVMFFMALLITVAGEPFNYILWNSDTYEVEETNMEKNNEN